MLSVCDLNQLFLVRYVFVRSRSLSWKKCVDGASMFLLTPHSHVGTQTSVCWSGINADASRQAGEHRRASQEGNHQSFWAISNSDRLHCILKGRVRWSFMVFCFQKLQRLQSRSGPVLPQVRRPDLEVRILVRQLGWFEDKEWKQVDHSDGGFGGLGVKRTWYFVYQLATVYLPWYTWVISRSWLIRSEHLDYSKPRRNSAKPVLLSSASCRWRLSQLRNGREKLFCILCVRYKSKSGRPNNRVVKFQNCVVPCGLDLTLCSHMLRWAIQTFWWICLS